MPDEIAAWQCPAPSTGHADTVTLAHGEGGRLLRRLLSDRILPALGENAAGCEDSAILIPHSASIAFSTDSFVVSPLFFPGGDIGRLAVIGTANDLAVSGACPLWISLGLIIEEGLPLAILDRIMLSIGASARQVGVRVVTGDTKVVPRGAADGLFINTSGIGEVHASVPPGPRNFMPGDELIVSGPIGRHGVAVMAARDQLDFSPAPSSDCAFLGPAIDSLRQARIPVRAIRDATRGGVAAVLHEWAAASGQAMAVIERQVPVTDDVRGVCELLGLDPLHVANEGTMVLAVEAGASERAVEALRSVEVSAGAARIGRVEPVRISQVVVERSLGRFQPLDEPLGAPLPRIC